MDLILIIGPPAVGKMTVGQELAKLTGYKLLHNHMTIDPVLELFEYNSPPFKRLVPEFRRMLVREAAVSDIPGMICTFVWAFDNPKDRVFLDELRDIVAAAGGQTYYAELQADLSTRLVRNRSEHRLAHKPTKRDIQKSEEYLLREDRVFNTSPELPFPYPDRHIKIVNTDVSPSLAAKLIADHFAMVPAE